VSAVDLARPDSRISRTRLLLKSLDYVALERTGDGHFRLLTEPLAWFTSLFGSAEQLALIPITGRSLYLDHFIANAQMFWLSGKLGKISSGTWTELDGTGRSWALEAHATANEAGNTLVIQEVGGRHQEQLRILQTAREHLLTEEALEREVQRRTDAIRAREQEIAMRLLAAAATRDGETGGHVRRIGLYSAVLGEALGWAAARVEDIRLAAPMHDIGKIGIPDAILRKPSRLTKEEFSLMQQHTVIGARMLAGSESALLQMAGEIALCHHEKWNGSGYPSGIQGAAIPLSARIVAIVDVYDAMVSERIYKAAIPECEVIEAMRGASGLDFDPELFAVFEKNLDAIREIRNSVPR
jgi:HD-GYP domain-containing protein (c-di-GMP phosphodiesterase class II)